MSRITTAATWSRAVIYTRLSRDEEGQTSTARQEAEARALADRLTLPVEEIYAEAPGTSGFREGVERPQYDRLLRDLAPGTVVIAWALDRLTRRGMEQAGALLRVLEERGARLVTVSDGVDTANDGSELATGVWAILAREESKKISRRVRSEKERARREGNWSGSRPFGYDIVGPTRAKRLEQNRAEAAILRECVRRVFDGVTLRAVCAWLTREGITAPRGGEWRVTALNKVLTSPTLAGLQSSRGEIVRHDDGTPVMVTDAPIVSNVERARLLAVLEERGRTARLGRAPGASRVGRPPASLLTGFLRCAECKGAMTADRRNGVYRCNTRTQGGKCPGSTVDMEQADGTIANASLRRMAALEPGDPILDAVVDRWMARQTPTSTDDRTALVAAAADARASLADLEEARFLRRQFADALGVRRYEQMYASLSERLASAESALAALPDLRPNLSVLLDTVLSAEAWESATLEDRRAVLSLVLIGARVRKAKATGGRFDEARVCYDWVDAAPADAVAPVSHAEASLAVSGPAA